MSDTKKPNYTALVLDEDSHDQLSQYVPDGWKPFCHHMTLISPPEQSKGAKIDDDLLGREFSVQVDSILQDDKVIAAKVKTDLPLVGPKFAHITIAVNQQAGGKPMMSNNLDPSAGKKINQLMLHGKVEGVFM